MKWALKNDKRRLELYRREEQLDQVSSETLKKAIPAFSRVRAIEARINQLKKELRQKDD